MTDGKIFNPGVIVNLIRSNKHKVHVHTFGIGLYVDRNLIKGCAAADNGSYYFTKENENLIPKVVAALSKACAPSCTEIEIIWPENTLLNLQAPSKDNIKTIYINEPFTILALIKKLPEDYIEIIKEKV